jgi:DNA mismatch endonuclease (patch repair protein)
MVSGKAPRYERFEPSSASASHVKRRNKSKNTRAELLLRKALWARGLRYRLHVSKLPGKPDMVLSRMRVAVFIDGDFWHGRNWEELEKKLTARANPEYWIAKIQYNRDRDREQALALEQEGWTVLRLWETDVIRDLQGAVACVLATLRNKDDVNRGVPGEERSEESDPA